MEKSEKSFYVIIENKRFGKFSGTSPIQVAKKVSSKKMKTGKKTEITFYLDEVGGKKKRYGLYQGRKDKKTNKIAISVVKKGKIMKGGVLTEDMKRHIKGIFENNCKYTDIESRILYNYTKTIYLPINFSFGGEPLIFFNPILINTESPTVLTYTGNVSNGTRKRVPIQANLTQQNQYKYKYAVFKETNGRNIWILLRNPLFHDEILFLNFVDFFLNPNYLDYFTDNSNIPDKKKYILECLKNEIIIPSRTIRVEAEKIYDFLYVPVPVLSSQNSEKVKKVEKVFIYVPNDSHPLIKKCVYSNLKFGILDEETPYVAQSIVNIAYADNNYQMFLIKKKPFFGGFSEPVIYLRKPKSSTIQLMYDFFIYTLNGKIMIKSVFSQKEVEFTENMEYIPDIAHYCKILYEIPFEFGGFERIRRIARSILQKQSIRLTLQLNTIITGFPKNKKQLNKLQIQNQQQIQNQIQQIIQLLKQREPQQPEQSQLNKLQSLLKQSQTSQFNLPQDLLKKSQPQSQSQPQQTLEQVLIQLQEVLQ